MHVSNKREIHARGHLRSFTILLHGTYRLFEIWQQEIAVYVPTFRDLLEDLSQ